MNKRITSIVLSLVMLFSMLATAVPALATTPVELKVTANTTSANPGDTINYKVSIGAVTNTGGLEFYLDIPSGLTIVESSIIIPDGLETIIDSDGEIVSPKSENSYYWAYSAQSTGYTGTETLVILTFSCTVDADVLGNKSVSVKNVLLMDNTYDMNDIPFVVTPATITVTAAPKPATAITLDKSTTTIHTGNTEKLTETVTPADTTDNVVWTSSNESVATVDNTGKVTAVAPGTATITAKAGSKSATCVVTVENAPCAHAHKDPVPAKDSTCKDKGWDAYEKCRDCGAVLTADGKIPFRPLSTTHTGGTATCTQEAVCTVCNQPYGGTLPHTYTAQEKKPEALKTRGTCQTEAVYYYSCSMCHAVEHNDSHTFNGDKDSANHNPASVWSHDDDKHWKACTNGTCSEHLNESAHSYSGTWEKDSAKHWHSCTECGFKKDEAAHVFDREVATDAYKATDATCTAKATYYKSCVCGEKGTATFGSGETAPHSWKPATCTEPKTCENCGDTEGTALGHNYDAAAWSSNAGGHWHACKNAACTEQDSFAAHTPDREAATENDPVKCSVCGYIIAPALGHIHSLTKVEAKPATHTEDGTVEYYKCGGCGKLFADASGNVELTAEQIVDKAVGHDYEWKIDREATATENGLKHEECKVCGDKKAAVEIPATGAQTDATDSEKPTASDKDQKSPKTGDSNNMILWAALLFVSSGSVATTAIYSRKRKRVK